MISSRFHTLSRVSPQLGRFLGLLALMAVVPTAPARGASASGQVQEAKQATLVSSASGRSSTPSVTADEVVVPRRQAMRAYPFALLNAKSFATSQEVDQTVVGPIGLAYGRMLPKPLRSGLRNFLNKSRERVVFVSFLLEFKPGMALTRWQQMLLANMGANLFHQKQIVS